MKFDTTYYIKYDMKHIKYSTQVMELLIAPENKMAAVVGSYIYI